MTDMRAACRECSTRDTKITRGHQHRAQPHGASYGHRNADTLKLRPNKTGVKRQIVSNENATAQLLDDIPGDVFKSWSVEKVGGSNAVNGCGTDIALGIDERAPDRTLLSVHAELHHSDLYDAMMAVGGKSCGFNIYDGEFVGEHG